MDLTIINGLEYNTKCYIEMNRFNLQVNHFIRLLRKAADKKLRTSKE